MTHRSPIRNWKLHCALAIAVLGIVTLTRYHTLRADPPVASDAEHSVLVTNGAVRYSVETIDESRTYAAAHPEDVVRYVALRPGTSPDYPLAKAIADGNWVLASQIADSINNGTFDASITNPRVDLNDTDVGDDDEDEEEPGDGTGANDENPDFGEGPYISFNGPNVCGCEPPDSNMTVGSNNLLLAINDQLRCATKTGTTVWSVNFETFFASVNPGGAGTSDPKVFWDPTTQRYFVCILYINSFSNPTHSWWMVAVSTSDVISDSTTTWRKWAFDSALADPGKFADYPSFGYDNDAIYITSNMFSGPTVDLAVFPKAQLLVNTPSPTFTQIVNIKTSSNINAHTLQPCLMLGANIPNCYFVNTQSSSGSNLFVYKMNNPLSSPSLTKTSVPITAYSTPPGGSQSGTTTTINPVDSRTFSATWQNDTIYCAHETNSGGLCSAQWFQVNTSAWPTATLNQSGIYNNGSAHYLFPTVSVDINGNMAMGFTRTKGTEFPSAWHTSRLVGDSAGTLAAPSLDFASSRAYTGTRWGDYSATVIDPADNTTFWTIQEYNTGTTAWATRVTSFQLCGAITENPSLPNGTEYVFYNQSITASGGSGSYTYTVSAGSPPTGLSLSSGGVLSGTPTAPGVFNFSVKATDSAGCTGTQAYSIQIVCPGIPISPATLPDGVYGASYNQPLSASGGTPSYTWSLFSGSLPPNINLSPSGLISGSPTAVGIYNFAVLATDSQGCASSWGYVLTIQTDCPIPGDINGDGFVNGLDIQSFVDCYLTGTTAVGNCRCGDFNLSNAVDGPDIGSFVNAMLP